MFRRFRLFAAGFALIFSLGIVCVGASAATSARISAHLTRNSFTPAQAGTVKLVYQFLSKSSRFAYVLSRRAGSAWATVRSVSKRGSFRGSHTITVKSVFGSKPITAAKYRLKLSGSANSVTLSFTVVPPETVKPVPPETVKPRAGKWAGTLNVPATGGGGTATFTILFFTVAPDQASVSPFGLNYNYQGLAPPNRGCGGRTRSEESVPSPIADGQFSNPPGNVTWTSESFDVVATAGFEGTFDSATTAHGSAQASVRMSDPPPIEGLGIRGEDCYPATTVSTGTFTWTAAWEGS
jgi:hypothetical protein